MLLLLFGLFLLVSSGGSLREVPALVTVSLDELRIDPSSGDRIYNGLPFTGLAVQRRGDGQLASEEPFKNGRRHGLLRRWFDNGELAFESAYERGRRDGMTRSWWRNGNIRSKTMYVEDKANGIAWRWYRDGEKFKRYSFSAGVPSGIQQAWRRNGKLFSNFEYRNGRAYGLRNANLCVELENETVAIGG
tara:strand:+ start:1577 stop:2146 length:570 start_codon:yes stop_codon:yes gene_type:complete